MHVATDTTCTAAEKKIKHPKSRSELLRSVKSHRKVKVWYPDYIPARLFTDWTTLNMYEHQRGHRLGPSMITRSVWVFVINQDVLVIISRRELKNHHNQTWSGSALNQGLVCLTSRTIYPSSCVCLREPVLPFLRKVMLMETSWTASSRMGDRAPHPTQFSTKTYGESTGLRLDSQQDSRLLLCQL